MMRYMVVATLKRGSLEIPESLDEFNEGQVEREAFLRSMSAERDPHLTIEETWREQGRASGFFRRRA
jgi:hypothetical protein